MSKSEGDCDSESEILDTQSLYTVDQVNKAVFFFDKDRMLKMKSVSLRSGESTEEIQVGDEERILG